MNSTSIISSTSIAGLGKLYSTTEFKMRKEDIYSKFKVEYSKAIIKEISKYSEAIAKHVKGKYSSDTYIWYAERQMTAPIISALNKIATACISELPVKRDKVDKRVTKKKDNGRVDYWALFEKSDFYMEVKHFTMSNKFNGVIGIHKLRDSDYKKLRRTFNHFNTDRLNKSIKPNCLLINTFAISMESNDYNLIDRSVSDDFQRFLKNIRNSDKKMYDEVFAFEWKRELVLRNWTEEDNNKTFWPYLFIGFKKVRMAASKSKTSVKNPSKTPT
jgi:hypothetical protein